MRHLFMPTFPIAVIWVIALVMTGCGGGSSTSTTTTTTALLPDQARVAVVLSSGLSNYVVSDTLRVVVIADQLSVEGGGGLVAVATAVPITWTGSAYVATRSYTIAGPSTVTETYTLAVNGSGLITDLTMSVQVGAAAAQSAITTVETPPTLASGLIKKHGFSDSSQLFVDSAGRCWWDLNGGSTTDSGGTDTVAVTLRANGAALRGKATVTTAGPVYTTVTVDLVLDGAGALSTATVTSSSGGILVNALPPTSTAVLPTVGPWSADMAGHWLGMPSSGQATRTGTLAVTRSQDPLVYPGGTPSGTPAVTSGNSVESIATKYEVEYLASGVPAIKVTRTVTASSLAVSASMDMVERSAVWWAMGSDGIIYRVGLWEDNNTDAVVDAAERTYFTGSPIAVFPAATPADGTALLATYNHAGQLVTSVQHNDVTFGATTGLFAFDGTYSAAASAYPTGGYDVTTGSASMAGVQRTYWKPGTGELGYTYTNLVLAREFTDFPPTAGYLLSRTVVSGTVQ
ncbi:MAG: hypothetical protein AAB263_17560 [Planctomycetota bacterium]